MWRIQQPWGFIHIFGPKILTRILTRLVCHQDASPEERVRRVRERAASQVRGLLAEEDDEGAEPAKGIMGMKFMQVRSGLGPTTSYKPGCRRYRSSRVFRLNGSGAFWMVSGPTPSLVVPSHLCYCGR
jgi:hypothetical protein